VSGKLVALILVRDAMPGRKKGMYATRLIDKIACGNIFYDLPLTAFDWGTQNNTTTPFFNQRKQAFSYKSSKMRTETLEGCNRPGLWRRRHMWT
jgi:hypothetical protein